jgi:hypothetical protein
MKKISPFQILVNGQQITVNWLYVILNNDNLNNNATFYYCFYNQIDQNNFGNKVIEGNLQMNGTDYSNFSTNNNANNFAYNWAAQKLGVTFI